MTATRKPHSIELDSSSSAASAAVTGRTQGVLYLAFGAIKGVRTLIKRVLTPLIAPVVMRRLAEWRVRTTDLHGKEPSASGAVA
jgi:hypothetical protein